MFAGCVGFSSCKSLLPPGHVLLEPARSVHRFHLSLCPVFFVDVTRWAIVAPVYDVGVNFPGIGHHAEASF